eukprot:COSAG06_NODE_55236_length_290_cov_1.230366_2_plen_43_part_01
MLLLLFLPLALMMMVLMLVLRDGRCRSRWRRAVAPARGAAGRQ